MAEHPAALTRSPQRLPVMTPRRCICILGLVFLATACTPRDTHTRARLVGKWQSSKLVTPVYLHDNGEWEIKQDDQLVLQYGVWEYKDNSLVWTYKIGSRISSDVNPVLAVTAASFQLRESDQSVTSFTRLP